METLLNFTQEIMTAVNLILSSFQETKVKRTDPRYKGLQSNTGAILSNEFYDCPRNRINNLYKKGDFIWNIWSL
jgi:hypothetical protein